jgi:hypothetical protein
VKLVKSDGRRLQVFEIGEPVFELAAQRFPIRLNGSVAALAGVSRLS